MRPTSLRTGDLNSIRGRQQVVFHVIGHGLEFGVKVVVQDDFP